MTVRAVAFDAVGTVIHPRPGAPVVYERLARRLGLPTEGILDRLRASYLAEEAIDRANGWATSEDREVARWRRIVADSLPGSGPEAFAELYDHFARPEAWAVDDALPQVLADLAGRHVRVVLASNYDSRLDRVLDGKPGLAALRPAVISSQVGVRKPSAEFFRAVARRLGLDAHEILYVGDDVGNDYHGATAAGMEAWLLDPRGRYPEISHRLTTLSELTAAGGLRRAR